MRYIRVRVSYAAPLIRDLAGVSSEEVEVEEGSTLRELVIKLAEVRGESVLPVLLDDAGRDLRVGVVALINGTPARSANAVVREGDEVVFSIIVDGG